MNFIEKICEKLAKWETSINNIPVEERKKIILKVSVVMFLILIVCTFGNQIYRTHRKESRIQEQPAVTMDSLYKKVDEELISVNAETQKALRLVDSLTKIQKENEK